MHTLAAKTLPLLCHLCNAALLAGLLLLAIGLYYWVIKAGIPYQDPPLELQIEYAIHMGIGDILVPTGAGMALLAGAARLLLWGVSKALRHP